MYWILVLSVYRVSITVTTNPMCRSDQLSYGASVVCCLNRLVFCCHIVFRSIAALPSPLSFFPWNRPLSAWRVIPLLPLRSHRTCHESACSGIPLDMEFMSLLTSATQYERHPVSITPAPLDVSAGLIAFGDRRRMKSHPESIRPYACPGRNGPPETLSGLWFHTRVSPPAWIS